MSRKTVLLLVIFIFSLLASQSVKSQDYDAAVGAKLGYGLLGTYKKFLNEDLAFEVFGGLRWGGFMAGGFVQKHGDIPDVDQLRWYAGVGPTFSTWTYGVLNQGYFEIAGHVNAGVEYTFEDFPLVVGLDYAPGIVLVDSYKYDGAYGRLRVGYGTLFARYILGGDTDSFKKLID